jgi:hypothetical protein
MIILHTVSLNTGPFVRLHTSNMACLVQLHSHTDEVVLPPLPPKQTNKHTHLDVHSVLLQEEARVTHSEHRIRHRLWPNGNKVRALALPDLRAGR